MIRVSVRSAIVALLLLLGVTTLHADEGMWLLNEPPTKLLKDRYKFDLTDDWLEHARLASVRFNSGGSGSFVSPHGLLVTNHHIGADALQKLSPKDKDYLRDGYHARTREQELKCPDLELNVLQSIEDVTDRVNGAVKPGATPAEAFAARRAVMADIEKESLDKTRLRSDVVTLYQGGAYHLYRYKKYTDVRLVFAPDAAVAGFGGDTDNFEYPRFGFDVCFFRAYEDDRPVKVKHYFKWSTKGAEAGDLVFVTGHPGTTNRLETVAKLQHRRDLTLPYTLNRLRTFEAMLTQFSGRGPEQGKMAREDLHRVANSRKAFSGQYQGLLDPAILKRKTDDEKALRDKVEADPELKKAYGDAWKRVEEAEKKYEEFERLYSLLETGHGFGGQLFPIARTLARLTTEQDKPNTERLREYRESNLESLKFQLFSPAPIHAELERAWLASGFSFLAENLGGAHPLVVKVLAGKSPATRAEELVTGTRLADPAERKKLVDGGVKAIEASNDAMIRLARLIDDEARAVRKRFETEVEEPERQANGQIAQARFKLFGRSVAPDATFTLRLAFGVVNGYSVDGSFLSHATTIEGMYARSEQMGGKEPFELPRRWVEKKSKLDLKTPFNFVSTSDTIGGNSGSPVLNRAGELVGINFDRNRHGLVRNFVYTDEQARHISVHCQVVLEALRNVYEADELVKELGP